MNATPASTLRDIVTQDFRAAAVFHTYGIDFCCGGTKTLAEACQERRACAEEVLREVQRACRSEARGGGRVSEWDADVLVAYIVSTHHGYVRRIVPVIRAHARRVASSHGDAHRELLDVVRIFDEVANEMTMHMVKEERILFPYIVQLAEAVRTKEQPPPPRFERIESPIRMMEAEHDSAIAAMSNIRAMTDDYRPPADACTTHRICVQELDAFERDLHEHVRLENGVLFPRARSLAAMFAL